MNTRPKHKPAPKVTSSRPATAGAKLPSGRMVPKANPTKRFLKGL